MSTNDFSTHFTTLSHNLINKKLINAIETTLRRKGTLYLKLISLFPMSKKKKKKKKKNGLNVGLAKRYVTL